MYLLYKTQQTFNPCSVYSKVLWSVFTLCRGELILCSHRYCTR